MKKIVPFLIICQLLISVNVFSQNDITGKVKDSKTNEAIVGAIVKLENSSIATLTDLDGNYKLSVKDGTYNIDVSYISYKNQKIPNIKVEGKAIVVDVSIDPDITAELSEVVVSETKVTNTEIATVMEMKKSNSIINSVSSAQISKSQDRDASEVIRRVPGVSIMDNRFIMVRGLADRYNNVWLNDAGAPSSEADKKSFSFDMVPSNLIDRILVYKTASADLPGDFAGAMVKIYTMAMPQKTGFMVNYQQSYRDGTTNKPYYHTKIYDNDWLGLGAKDREIPAPKHIGATMTDYSSSFNNDWILQQTKASPDRRFNIGFNGLIKRDKYKFGTVTSLSYANTYQTMSIHRQFWDSTKQQEDYSDLQSTNVSRFSVMQNFAFEYKNHKIEYRNFYNNTGSSQTTQRVSNLETAPNLKAYAFQYNQRTIYNFQLSGNHSFFNNKTEYSWTAGYSYNKNETPDLRRIKYSKQQDQPDSSYNTPIPAGTADPLVGGRFYSSLKENVKSFNHNLKQSIKINDKFSIDLNLGNYFEYKSRTFTARSLGYVIKPGMNAFYWKYLSLDSIFNQNHVGVPGGFQMDEITSLSDTYLAQNKLQATYLSSNFNLGKHFKVIGGIRYEKNTQSLQSYLNTDSISPSITTKFWLPSFNATYNIKEKHLFRAAFGKTLNRPEFREWSPFYFYDFNFNAGTYGSLFPTVISPTGSILKVAEITNYDVRYEFYPSYGEFFQIGAFYKKFINPIQQVILPSSGDSRAFSYVNADNAEVAGVEVDIRKKLSFIAKWTKINFFKDFSVVFNASVMQSKMNISKVINQATSTNLQGQSPYLINAGLYYQNDSTGTQVSLLYNTFGSRIYLLGTLDYANIGEAARHTLDISISQRIYKGISVNVSVQNILNSPFRLYQDTNRDNKFKTDGSDKQIMNYKIGAYYSFGLKVNI
jgi:TonB-dependent receptor